MKFGHFFLPHPLTHKRAHLISLPAFLIYIVAFIIFQAGIHNFGTAHPGVLGIASNIDQQTVIQLTNAERAKNGLPPLKENAELDKAATAKAQNMFAENYWAHFAPSGKSPWDFIKASGYSFSYAGENLARNFYNSSDVMVAWMNSPSHKENIINPHYQEIGIAVVNGTLLGEQTTLVVQEFGTPISAPLAKAPTVPTQVEQKPEVVQSLPAVENVASAVNLPVQASSNRPLFVDAFQASRTFGMVIIVTIMALILLDFVVMRRRVVYRVAERHLPHLMMLLLALAGLLSMSPGVIN